MKSFPIILLTLAGGGMGWWLGNPQTPVTQSAAEKPRIASKTSAPAATVPTQETTDPLSLLALRESEYPARLRRAFQQGWHGEMVWLARRWAARDPAGLFAFMTAPEGLGVGGTRWPDWAVTEACFEAWFKKDLPAALAAMKTLQQYDVAAGRMGYHGWQAILPKLMLTDPARAVQILAEHPDYGDSIVLRFDQMRGLADAALTLPECASRPGFLREVFRAFSKHPDRARGMADGLAWLAKLPPAVRLEALPHMSGVEPAELPMVKEMIRRSFSQEDLTAAATGAANDQNKRRLQNVAVIRAMLDPTEAMAWAAYSLDGAARHQAMEQIVASSLPDKMEDTGAILANLPPGPLFDRTLDRILQRGWENEGHQAAADWIGTLPEGANRQAALVKLSGNWAIQQPAEFLEWFGRQPEGSARSQLATAALEGVIDMPAKLELAGKLPESLALQALEQNWKDAIYTDSRAIAEAATRQPAGPLREAAMTKASHDSCRVFGEFNQAWLDWASKLPTSADRAAALRGAERSQVVSPKWAEGIEESARNLLR